MALPEEVIVTSDSSGQMWNCCIWEPHSDSSLIHYKGSASKPRSLCVLSGQYIISSDTQKPLLNMWEVQRKEQHQSRMVCPGPVASLAVSPDSVYCIAGIEEKIYVWQVSTGHLLAVLRRHFQRVTNICFTDDGCYFLTGGEDNLIMVWDLASVLQAEHSQSTEPIHIWSQHALPITDLHCGKGGTCSRVASSSQDQTCKLWDIPSGQLLYTFIFDTPILSVVMDSAESKLYAGGLDGNIYSVNLFEKLTGSQKTVSSDPSTGHVYKGHGKAVTCLSVSMDGSLLLSGSEDSKACLWHVSSGQCVRRLLHKGSVTNAMFVRTPPCLQTETGRPTLPIKPFQRQLHVSLSSGVITDAGDSESIKGAPVNMCHPLEHHQHTDWDDEVQSSILSEKKLPSTAAENEKEELANLRRINNHLRKLAATDILLSI